MSNQTCVVGNSGFRRCDSVVPDYSVRTVAIEHGPFTFWVKQPTKSSCYSQTAGP